MSTGDASPAGDVKSGAHSGTLNPKSKTQSLFAALRYRWGFSLARIILAEFCSLFLRIGVILRRTEVRFGPTIPLTLSGRNLKTLYPVNSFLLACSEGIKQLHAEFPWAGNLELTMGARAFQRGAEWSMGNNSETGSGDASCDQFSQVPDSGTDTSGHSGGDSQAGMDADEIIVREV